MKFARGSVMVSQKNNIILRALRSSALVPDAFEVETAVYAVFPQPFQHSLSLDETFCQSFEWTQAVARR